MKLGFAIIALAHAATDFTCSEKSEKRLTKLTAGFAEWTADNCDANKRGWMDDRVTGIAKRMLSHYNQFNGEICNAGARMGDPEDE